MPITIAGALASALLGAPDLAIPILATHQQRVINFTREHEQEADNVGIQLLADAGFDPQGMIALFKRMEQQEQYNIAIPEYLRTHPMFENRISEAQQRANHFHYCQHSSAFNYYLIKARIESTANTNKQETIANFEESINKKRYANKDATSYGYSLALTANYKYEQAYKILEPLTKKYPNNLIIQLSMIDLMLAKKEVPKAITKMESLLIKFPDDTALLLKYAENLIAVNKIDPARKSLLTLTKTKVFEPITYRLLAQAEGMSGNNIGMHQATAEWHVCYGNMEEAIIQLNLALNLAKDNDTLQYNLKRRKEEIEYLLKKKIN
jgi:predicted Zn-dependent protease